MNKQEFNLKASAVIDKYLDACYEMGLSIEQTKRILFSKQGVEMVNEFIAQNKK